ncbi:MAG TPA: hypothetical protein DCZ69_17900 [Syntrophobacteraceae bacterium]|nr:hypothetical protein [Syntrophobacteraceae bacterium]
MIVCVLKIAVVAIENPVGATRPGDGQRLQHPSSIANAVRPTNIRSNQEGPAKMNFQEDQEGTLLHLLQTEFSQAGDMLSSLAGKSLTIAPSQLDLREIRKLSMVLSAVFPSRTIKVVQHARGAVSGEVVLFLDHDSTLKMCSQLDDGKIHSNRLDASDQELVLEVGNMMIISSLSAIGRLVQTPLYLDSPYLSIDTLEAFLHPLTNRTPESEHALVVQAQLNLASESTAACLLLLLKSSFMDSVSTTMRAHERIDHGV